LLFYLSILFLTFFPNTMFQMHLQLVTTNDTNSTAPQKTTVKIFIP
jgi:hypothetical protein